MRVFGNAVGGGLLSLLAGVCVYPIAACAGPIANVPLVSAPSNVITIADFGRNEGRRNARRIDRQRWRDDDFVYSHSRYDPDYYLDDGDDIEYVTIYRSVRTVIVEPPYDTSYGRRRGGRVFTPFVEVQWRD